MRRIGVEVVSATSEEREHPLTELNEGSPVSKGWQSERFCEYPQELIVELPLPAHLTQIQVLSHQYKIPSKIEVWLQATPEAEFTAAGFVRMMSNDRSNYEARELKTITLDAEAVVVKLRLHECYVNKPNCYHQVGIIALAAFGSAGRQSHPPTHRSSGDPLAHETATMQHVMPPLWKGPFAESPAPNTFADGHHGPFSNRYPPGYPKATHDTCHQPLMDADTLRKVNDLLYEKEAAVAVQDYETAHRCKVVANRLQAVAAQLVHLEAEKVAAARREEFATAHRIVIEMDAIRENALTGGPLNHTYSPMVDSRSANKEESKDRVTRARLAKRGVFPMSPQKAAIGSPSHWNSADTITRMPELDMDEANLDDQDHVESKHSSRIPNADDRPLDVGRGTFDWGVNPVKWSQTGRPGSGLPIPEPLSERDRAAMAPCAIEFGTELARCACSTHRTLREYALALATQRCSELEPTSATLQACAALALHSFQEKIPLVFEKGIRLLKEAYQVHAQLPSKELASAFEELPSTLTRRLREPQQIVRGVAEEGLLYLAQQDATKAAVASAAAKELQLGTDAGAAAPLILGRLGLFVRLLSPQETGSNSVFKMGVDLQVDQVMPVVHAGFDSPNGAAREHAKEVMIVLSDQLGETKFQGVLASLSEVQRAEVASAVAQRAAMNKQLEELRALTAVHTEK